MGLILPGTMNILEVNLSPSRGRWMILLPSPAELESLFLVCGPAPRIDGILWEPHPAWALLLALRYGLIAGSLPVGLLYILAQFCVYWAKHPVLGELGAMCNCQVLSIYGNLYSL